MESSYYLMDLMGSSRWKPSSTACLTTCKHSSPASASALLIGLERERQGRCQGRLRTFALVALLGTLCAMLDPETGSYWILAVGLLRSAR
jgi:hypothetical protein